MSHAPKNSFNLLMGICISAGQHLAALETFKFPSLWSAKLNSITSPKANLETADQQRQKNRELTSHWHTHTHRYPAFQQKTIGFCQYFTKKVNWGSQFCGPARKLSQYSSALPHEGLLESIPWQEGLKLQKFDVKFRKYHELVGG